MTQPGFDMVEKPDEFTPDTEKRKVLLRPFFQVAGKHAEEAEEQGYRR
ncbi:MAG: hypothetical protein VB106_19585 [Clostridiaceae bacterium]|nr:hypothetical protein [Clostridiaceae bacterium]